MDCEKILHMCRCFVRNGGHSGDGRIPGQTCHEEVENPVGLSRPTGQDERESSGTACVICFSSLVPLFARCSCEAACNRARLYGYDSVT